MTTNIIEFGRIFTEDLAQGNSPETVILADGQPLLMHPLLSAKGIVANDAGGKGAGQFHGNLYLSPTNTAAQNVAGWTALLSDIASGGGLLTLEQGVYPFNAGLTWPTGLTVHGVGLGYSTSVGTHLDFSAMAGSAPIITWANVNGGGIKDLTITGRAAGATGNAIAFSGTNRQAVLENLIVTDHSSDGACLGWDHTTGGFSTILQFRNVRTGTAYYGWHISAAGNNVAGTMTGCYANGHQSDGFRGRWDQWVATGCYAETNGGYGWYFLDGINPVLVGCSTEQNGKAAVKFDNCYGGSVYGLLGALNNTLGSATVPSMIETANGCLNLTVCGIDEASATAGTTYSIAHTSGAAPTISFAANRLQNGYDATMDAMPRIQSGGIYIGGKIHYYGTAAPTTGTWNDGDIVWNTSHSLNNIPGWVYTGTAWRRLPYTIATDGPYVYWSATAPALGTGIWQTGDVVYLTPPVVGQPIGWVCTGGGTPGTWGAMPNLA